MRSISVSTEVYAKIWSLRIDGEESEDAILKRVLSINRLPTNPSEGGPVGVVDSRYHVVFPEGFEIFRTYLGKSHRAQAASGRWFLLSDEKYYGSLNELSKAIGAGTENAWLNWKFADQNGQVKAVSELRRSTLIVKRTVSRNRINGQSGSHGHWPDDLIETFRRIPERHVPLKRIYEVARVVRIEFGRSVPHEFEATVRERLESHSSDSDSFKSGRDLFYMPLGKGAGVWGLRDEYHRR